MPLSAIVVIVLRLFAIQALLQSIVWALSVAATQAANGGHVASLGYLGAVGVLGFAILEWVLAPSIARLVTRGHDTELSIGRLTRADLYSFAFVFLGLYFIFSSIGQLANSLHYYLTISASRSELESSSAFYKLAAPVIRMGAGIFALLFGRRWTLKLIDLEKDQRVIHSPGSPGNSAP